MIWPEIAAVVLLGLGGSFGHCVGMCGGFALAVGTGASGVRGVFGRHVAYQAGKALTYVFLAVILTAGLAVVGRRGGLHTGQVVLSLAAGVMMLLYGSMQVFEWRPLGWLQRALEPLPGCRSLASVARTPGWIAAFATGWLNGFLPCGLVYAMLFQLASAGSIFGSMLGAVAFGAATFPGLFLFGLAAHAWRPGYRRAWVRVTGGLLLLFGLVTIVRAFPAGRHWMHTMVPQFWNHVKEWCGF